ncbi:aminodeoxychorismate synthase component I [Trinickia terrae]|uniref:Aminodeoxychorismate synthase component I n=1 Tax=Trinickia terrae TaxID=2571161 RepID=A0A4U1IBX9_9BURK|nr:aminodeoxychorismate synthase component I [Trinickia terrae]TKC91086.1 aminodeoxychorismate synthase component I [Trinickia terrae]
MTADEVRAGSEVFALLDDCDSTAAVRSSRLYTGFVREHVCSGSARLDEVCAAAEGDARHGLHAAVLADYEFGRNLSLSKEGGFASSQKMQPGNASLHFLMFSRCDKLSRDEADAWLAGLDGGTQEPSVAGAMNVTQSVTEDEFAAAIAAVHEALREGESYQVNYTYRLAFDVFGSPFALYRRLRRRQPVRYGALIARPGGAWVVSCSPELFVEKAGARLRARPMKGTAARAPDPADDARAADFLANDPKNRAENVMIVDLLRNDLSRISKTGSVSVPALFSIEPYPSVWQMTSTVEADAHDGVTFADVLGALFPCGSITGAPKYRTMQLIDAIETTPRGLYTGAIGWLDAPPLEDASTDHGPACGDFCMSVAIRTLELAAPSAQGLRRGTMGVGGGVVLDSVAADEYTECRLKASFLTGADPGLQLFETMHASREAGVRHLDLHLDRLGASSHQLGFAFDEAGLRERIAERCAQLPAGVDHRFRLALAKSGHVEIVAAPLVPLSSDVAGVALAPEHGFAPTQATDPLLRHKTTHRAEYDRGWREAEAHGGFDMLFFNERGELTEGGRSNVFVKLDGRWWTPPLSSGVLPGVMRRVLLADAGFQAGERVLVQADLFDAEALMVCNALRGALPARLMRK